MGFFGWYLHVVAFVVVWLVCDWFVACIAVLLCDLCLCYRLLCLWMFAWFRLFVLCDVNSVVYFIYIYVVCHFTFSLFVLSAEILCWFWRFDLRCLDVC